MQSDIELYTRLMNDIKNELDEGITLANMDQTITNKLVKIILKKCSKELQNLRKKD